MVRMATVALAFNMLVMHLCGVWAAASCVIVADGSFVRIYMYLVALDYVFAVPV